MNQYPILGIFRSESRGFPTDGNEYWVCSPMIRIGIEKIMSNLGFCNT